jgi:hypothetical protein
VLIPDGDDIGLPPALAGEGGVGEDLPCVPVDDVEPLHLARVPEIVGHRLVHAQVRVLSRHLRYLARKLARKYVQWNKWSCKLYLEGKVQLRHFCSQILTKAQLLFQI